MRDSKRNFYMKNNFINTYDGPYKKSNMKNNQYDLENERNKDTIIKLKEQIIAKDKEISNLKVSKIKKDEQYYKTMKILEQIVKNDTPSNNKKIKNKNKSKKKKNNINNYNTNGEYTKRSQTENLRENTSRENLEQNEIDNENNNEIEKNDEKNENEEQDLQKKKRGKD